MRGRLIPLIAAALVLCGCTMIPKSTRPPLPVPPAWPEAAAGSGAPAGSVAVDVRWREFFTDHRLRSVIDLALANNRDLRVANNYSTGFFIQKITHSPLPQKPQREPTANNHPDATIFHDRMWSGPLK